MKEIPLLTPSDIEVRVQSVFKGYNGGASALLLLYKSARVDMRILDEVYGPLNWKRSHECIDGALFCTISVWDADKKEWISKQDVGVPSNRDSKKGEASDAFKRAGFNWGIGRELYDTPPIFVTLNANEIDGSRGKLQAKSSARFYVADIDYDRAAHEFRRLVIVDKDGNQRFFYGSKKQTARKPAQGSGVSAETGLSMQLADTIQSMGVDNLDDFANYGFGTRWSELKANSLVWLKENLDQAVNQYKNRAVA